MTPQEEAQTIRQRQHNCKGHTRAEHPTWIPSGTVYSMSKALTSLQCAHCGIKKSDYEAPNYPYIP